jgi:hypothetical protein
VSLLATASVAAAQSRPPQRSGDAGDLATFEVLAVDPQGWIVTARDVESGEELGFQLPSESFRGLRFMADLSGVEPGRTISVTGEPGVRMRQALVERPLGASMRREGGFGERPAGGERDPGRFALPEGPGKYGMQDPQREPSRFDNRPPSPGQRGGGSGRYELIEFDAATRTATVRGEDGSTVSLEVDPRAFVGYRFRASVRNLRAGEGFELLADNERPLTDCCIVRERPRR